MFRNIIYQIGYSHVCCSMLIAESLPFREFGHIIQLQLVFLMSRKNSEYWFQDINFYQLNYKVIQTKP